MKYGFLVDDREFDRLGEVFTKDAVVDYRPMMVSHLVDGVEWPARSDSRRKASP